MTVPPVRAFRNFVNLGKLYSVPPWRTAVSYDGQPVRGNFVNLGGLYTRIKTQTPPSWAYFDDGSVFIAPYEWLPQHVLEKRMNIATHFLHNPSPNLQAIRQKHPLKKRLILIGKNESGLSQNTFHILARNAQNGQRVTVVEPPFEDVVLQLDESGSHPISARFKDAPQLDLKHRLRNSEALETFRGTLVDGVLQPNVRLGNGLVLSSNPGMLSPQLQERRRKRDYKARALRESVGLPNRAPAKVLDQVKERPPPPPPPSKPDSSPPARQKYLPPREAPNRPVRQRSPPPVSDKVSSAQVLEIERREAQIAQRERDIQAKERELEQRDEILRWKRKTWVLEQKLAMADGGRPPPGRDRYQDDGNVQLHRPRFASKTSYKQEASSEPHVESTGDGFRADAFDLDAASPPEALEKLRSRIQLPNRRTLRSK